MRISVRLSLITLIIGLGCLAHTQRISASFVHDQLKRHYLLHLPAGYTKDPLPLVLVLHGRGGNGEHIANYTEFDQLSDQYGFITLYPDGIDTQWNYVEGLPNYSSLTTRDSSFLLQLIDHVAGLYAVDAQKIYLAGFSNGGFMAQRLACEAPERFAAFASVAAAGFGGMPYLCNTPSPISMMLIHGTLDAVIPWAGLTRENFMMLAPVPDSIAFWATYSGCQGEVEKTELPKTNPKTYVNILSVGCLEGQEVILYIVHGGGHNWPGKTGISEAIAGNVSMDVDATEVIWNFFQKHLRR